MRKNLIAITAGALSITLIGSTQIALAVDKPVYVESAATTAATITPFLTSGDVVGKYTFPGTPDGMGAYENKDGTITLLVNHEFSLTNTAQNSDDFIVRDGALRPSGVKGSTISKLILNPSTLAVKSAADAIKKYTWWNYETNKYGTSPVGPAGAPQFDSYGAPVHDKYISRFCAAYLASAGSLEGSGKTGWKTPLFLTTEEASDESRAFVLDPNTGEMIQLPRFGLAANEAPYVAKGTGDDTVVIINEDAGATGVSIVDSKTATMANMAAGDQIRLYIGSKTAKGSFADRAGFTNGYLSVLKVPGIVDDAAFRAAYPKGTVAKGITFPEINWNADGATQNVQARLLGTSFARNEGGRFNPNNPNEYWFQTTRSGVQSGDAKTADGFTRNSGGLWKLTFTNVAKPNEGATLELVLDGSESILANMPDNFEFSSDSRYILMQEDPGANETISRVLAYDTVTKKFAVVAKFVDSMFNPKNTATFITSDEETSGILNVTSVLKASNDTFFFNAQVHPMPGALNAEVSIAEQVTKMRPDLTFADDDAKLAYKTKVIEGGQLYKLEITNWSNLSWS